MKEHLLGWLLFHANRNRMNAVAFYAIKRRLLNKYARQEGEDIQHIQKQCWTCEGTGTYWTGESCFRCIGGLYDEFVTRLDRWKIGRYLFHCPAGERIYRHHPEFSALRASANIKDYIYHEPSALGDEAEWILYLIYDRQAFRKTFGKRSRGLRVPYPITFLSGVVMWFRYHLPHEVAKIRRWGQDCRHWYKTGESKGDFRDPRSLEIPF